MSILLLFLRSFSPFSLSVSAKNSNSLGFAFYTDLSSLFVLPSFSLPSSSFFTSFKNKSFVLPPLPVSSSRLPNSPSAPSTFFLSSSYFLKDLSISSSVRFSAFR